MTDRLDPVRAWHMLHPKQQELLGAAAIALGVADNGIAWGLDTKAWDAASVEAAILIADIARAHVLHQDMLPDGLDLSPLGIQQCRACGCTENCACDGGCGWIEDDLCSACAPGSVAS